MVQCAVVVGVVGGAQPQPDSEHEKSQPVKRGSMLPGHQGAVYGVEEEEEDGGDSRH